MIRITALNEVESDKDSDPVKELSREMLEQIAFQQYAKALDLHSRGNIEYATQLYKDLLDTELLYGVKKPEADETPSQLWYLKYVCHKNLASLLSSAGKLDEGIEAYSAASELDDTDVSLWYRFGQVCMQAKHFEMALYAFQRGVECNPRHWPCLDHFLTLILAFDYTEQCIVTIHQALELDPGYLRGLVYRRHIYTVYKHMREYMKYLNPLYKWKEDDVTIDEEKAKVLLKEAEVIYNAYVEQQKAEKFVYMVGNVTLKKPISRLTWESVGDSLVHMHHYMTEHCFSHACFIEIKFENAVKMELCVSGNYVLEITNEAVPYEGKTLIDIKKVESDIEIVSSEVKVSAAANELAIQRRSNRTRKSARQISNKPRILRQWHWYTKTLSTRGQKGSKKKYRIHDTLRGLSKEVSCNLDIQKMFESVMTPDTSDNKYFGTESEQNDVKEFIKKYTENKKDIIDLLNDYLSMLACKWRKKWPTGLAKIFIEANTCYSAHIDIPPFANDNNKDLLHYTRVNLLVEELLINEKLMAESAEQVSHKLSVLDSMEIILTVNAHIFPSNEYLDLIQRTLRLKILAHILNGSKDLGLECLYQLHYELVDA